MNLIFSTLMAIGALLLLAGCNTTPDSSKDADYGSSAPIGGEAGDGESEMRYVFGWGNLPLETADPRGGTTTGTPVTFAAPRKLPLDSIASAGSAFEKDRAAILSLAGDYRTSFHFLETMGLYEDHEPGRPYHSWATEEIRVIEDRGGFISLQHTLVMHFQMPDGSEMEPMVMKHWRQDWTYEDEDLHTFRGNGTWARDRRSSDEVAGMWSQAVWQVDDSPRYEAIGKWTHDGNRSAWAGENSWRPLPRREHSVRDDYGVMEGFHRIVITSKGWIHEQNNWKRVSGEGEAPRYRGHELGIDRYERIVSPSLDKANPYWDKAGAYWKEVRDAWNEVFSQRDRFSLRSKVDGRSQFEYHFEYAGKLEAGEAYDVEEGAKFARDTIQSFLTDSPEAAKY
jgi:hypothetical protein